MPSVVVLTSSAAPARLAPTSSQPGDVDPLAESLTQRFGAAERAVGDSDALDAARQETMDHRARCAAGAEHHRLADAAIPTRRAGVEIVQKPLDVGIGRAQNAVIEPERIDGADRARPFVGRRQRKRRFLMRHSHIGADITARGERADKRREFFRRHQLAPVFAGDADSA